MLTSLAENLGHDEMAERFREALVEEKEHLRLVRGWMAFALRGQAGVDPTPSKAD